RQLLEPERLGPALTDVGEADEKRPFLLRQTNFYAARKHVINPKHIALHHDLTSTTLLRHHFPSRWFAHCFKTSALNSSAAFLPRLFSTRFKYAVRHPFGLLSTQRASHSRRCFSTASRCSSPS